MNGLSAITGRPIAGVDHLRQSIGDILTTPIGTRVMRRDYGSLLFELIDQPFHAATKVRIYAAVALAIARWEPRLRLLRVAIERGDAAGRFTLTVTCQRRDVPAPSAFQQITLPLRQDAARVLSLA